MSSTVLVTGAGGFIGSAVVRRLVSAMATDNQPVFADGSTVKHVVALLRHGSSDERLKELTPTVHWSIAYADISNSEELAHVLKEKRPRAIMHLAVESRLFDELPEDEISRINEKPLEAMFEALAVLPKSRLIHTSSVWVLKPGMNLAEDAAVEPDSPYARAKVRLDEQLPELQKKTRVEWINLRLFNVYGKYEAPTRLLPYLVSQLSRGKLANLSHGDQIRDFNDVDDIAEAYVLALKAGDEACGHLYHIGSGIGLSVKQFATIVSEVTGNLDLVRYGSNDSPDQQMSELVSDPSLAVRMLGWQPVVDPAEKIRRAARWWLDINATN